VTWAKTRATRERAWICPKKSISYMPRAESGGGASERIFLAGENPRVLAQVTRTARP
jgi:hypothetical protein